VKLKFGKVIENLVTKDLVFYFRKK